MKELKPCPFCGGKADIQLNCGQKPLVYGVVYCTKCQASPYWSKPYDKVTLAIEEVTELWNRRAEQNG